MTDRLPKYLSAPTKKDQARRLTFARRLMQKAVERQYDKNFRHEAKHAIDDFNNWVEIDNVVRYGIVLTPPTLITGIADHFIDKGLVERIIAGSLTWLGLAATSMMSLPYVAYKLSPAEFRARKFAEKTGKTEDEQRIVKFKFLK